MTRTLFRPPLSRSIQCLLWVLLLLAPIAVSPAPRPSSPRRPVASSPRRPAQPVTHQYGIYLLGSRVGTSVVTQTPTTHAGRPALRVDASTEMKLVVLAAVEQKIDLRQLLDSSGRPLTLSMTMSSGGRTTKVDARFTPSQVECTIDSGGTKSEKTVPIPEGVSLIADPEQVGPKSSGTKLKPGVKMRLHMFEPMTLQILPIDMEVLPPETLTLGDKQYRATVVKSTTSLTGESRSWLDDQGELLQQESLLGLKMVRESTDGATGRRGDRASAEVGAPRRYVPPPDFAVATSIRTERVIPDPRSVTFLRLKVEGIPEERLVLSDARQSAEVTQDNGKLTVVYTVRAEGTTGEQADKPSELAHPVVPGRPIAPSPYLAAAPYLEVDDPRIRKQAREIVGDATDPLEKARRIRTWVHGRMKPRMDIGIIRSATDVLAHPVGVCRDYAVLFTALARAAGIPARVCGGIVYMNGGFFYHAWSEVGVQASGDASPKRLNARTPEHLNWVAFDPTLPNDFVDATHIKFSQGDATDMFQAVRVVGQLKAEVLEYRPAP